jgi:DNA-binding MarR family transcriptional regulator
MKKKKDHPAQTNRLSAGSFSIPTEIDPDVLLMSGVLTRVGRLNELFLSLVTRKVFGSMKHGYGEPWVLYILMLEGPPYRSSPTVLCRRSLLTSGGMTKTLGKLEDAGLITRIYDANDRRALLVELTPKGQEWGTALMRQVAESYDAVFGKDAKQHYEALRTILTHLERLTGQIDTRSLI